MSIVGVGFHRHQALGRAPSTHSDGEVFNTCPGQLRSSRGEVKHHKNVDLEPGTLSTMVTSSWSVLDNLEIANLGNPTAHYNDGNILL